MFTHFLRNVLLLSSVWQTDANHIRITMSISVHELMRKFANCAKSSSVNCFYKVNKKAVLLQSELHNATENLYTYLNLQQCCMYARLEQLYKNNFTILCAVSLPQHGFPFGLCLSVKKWSVIERLDTWCRQVHHMITLSHYHHHYSLPT